MNIIGNQYRKGIGYDPKLIERLNKETKGKEPEADADVTPVAGIENIGKWIILNEQSLISTDKYYHNHNWHDMHRLLQSGNQFMPTLLESNQFDKLVYNGINEKHSKVHYADETLVPLDELKKIFNGRYEVRSSWRGEYLDARFEQREDGLYILSNNIIQLDGSLKPQNEEILEDTLMENRIPGINLEEWIRNPNKHGLPKPDISSGSLYYWCPTDERVAGLCADTDGANLDCYRNPSNSYVGFEARKIWRRR